MIMALEFVGLLVQITPGYASDPNEDVCELDEFLNEDGMYIRDNECSGTSMITTDFCQPKNRSDWADPECPYGRS